LAVDFLVSGSLKFLCGGPGIAFLYVDPDVAGDLQPASQGWSGVADVFGFETRDPEPAAGAGRFQTGTPPATAASTASAGLSFVLEYGVHRIRDRVRERIRPAHRRAPVPRPSGSNSK
jgi:kynureninase